MSLKRSFQNISKRTFHVEQKIKASCTKLYTARFHLYNIFEIKKILEIEDRLMDTSGWGGVVLKGGWKSVWLYKRAAQSTFVGLASMPGRWWSIKESLHKYPELNTHTTEYN